MNASVTKLPWTPPRLRRLEAKNALSGTTCGESAARSGKKALVGSVCI